MTEVPRRLVEVRLLVAVTVDLEHSTLIAALIDAGNPSSVAEMVADEISSNLESVPYVGAVIVARL